MMRYIFEDCETEILPQFFMKFYGDDVKNDCIWCGGNGAVWSRVRGSADFDTYEIIFLDFNPWNSSIVDIYGKIIKKIRRFGHRYIVIPTVCSEYNFLKSLDCKYLTEKDLMSKLKEVVSMSEIVTDKIKTYEDYCKEAALTKVVDIAVPDREINKGLVYFTEDTFGDRIQDKWLKFVGEYEVFPKIPKDVCV